MLIWRVVGAIMLITVLIVGLSWVKNEPKHPLIGKEFTNFGLEAEDGNVFEFASGKPMSVMFFASWCPYCNRGIDAYKEFAETRDDVNIVLINVHDFEENENDAPTFIRDKKIEFPVLYDIEGKYTDELGIDAVPINIILDEKGIITDVINGDISVENLGKIFP